MTLLPPLHPSPQPEVCEDGLLVFFSSLQFFYPLVFFALLVIFFPSRRAPHTHCCLRANCMLISTSGLINYKMRGAEMESFSWAAAHCKHYIISDVWRFLKVSDVSCFGVHCARCNLTLRSWICCKCHKIEVSYWMLALKTIKSIPYSRSPVKKVRHYIIK